MCSSKLVVYIIQILLVIQFTSTKVSSKCSMTGIANDKFIFIQDLGIVQKRYKSMVPDVNDLTFEVHREKVLRCHSKKALETVIKYWLNDVNDIGPFNLEQFNIISKYYIPEISSNEPNKVAITEPNSKY